MKPRHSHSLLLIWRVAEFEARHLNSSVIGPTHLLLGLLKAVDLDLPELISRNATDREDVLEEWLREVRRLRTVFRVAGLTACASNPSACNRSPRSKRYSPIPPKCPPD